MQRSHSESSRAHPTTHCMRIELNKANTSRISHLVRAELLIMFDEIIFVCRGSPREMCACISSVNKLWVSHPPSSSYNCFIYTERIANKHQQCLWRRDSRSFVAPKAKFKSHFYFIFPRTFQLFLFVFFIFKTASYLFWFRNWGEERARKKKEKSISGFIFSRAEGKLARSSSRDT